jgi:site-specific DNA recombinase
MGEEEQYYIKNHHEPIISAEIWDKAKEIREHRYRISNTIVDGTRMKATRKYAFSSMCQCGFCGKYFSRRSHNQDTKNKKPVWKCRTDKSISVLESKRKKLTDMLLDDKITKDAYDEKFNDFTRKINQEKEERNLYSANVNVQSDVGRRMKNILTLLTEADGIKKFDRVVFESIVEKVIVGDTNEDGSVDPYKLTFVLKGLDNKSVPNAKDRYMNFNKKTN